MKKINKIILVIGLILLCLFANHQYDIAVDMCKSAGHTTEYCLNGLK